MNIAFPSKDHLTPLSIAGQGLSKSFHLLWVKVASFNWNLWPTFWPHRLCPASCLALHVFAESYCVLKWLFHGLNLCNFNVYLSLGQRETEHERGRGRERGRHRIGSRLQALSHQPRAWCGARTHGPRDRDLAEVGHLTDWATQAPLSFHFVRVVSGHLFALWLGTVSKKRESPPVYPGQLTKLAFTWVCHVSQ